MRTGLHRPLRHPAERTAPADTEERSIRPTEDFVAERPLLLSRCAWPPSSDECSGLQQQHVPLRGLQQYQGTRSRVK